ncbi:MAG: cytochrome c oxidase assembly protein [Gaiellales bacterium]
MTPPPASSFTFEPLILVLVAAAGVAYVREARRTHVPAWRGAIFMIGLALVAVPLNSPLETIAEHYLLLVHLLQNAMIADWAPPLLIIGLTPAMREAIARRGGRPMAAVTQPMVALPLWLAVWYGVHLDTFYDYALRHPWALTVEHLLLVTVGLIFWWPVIARTRRTMAASLILYLLAAFVGASFLGLAFTFVTHPFYSFYAQAPRLWGIGPSEDQNLGGVIMNAEQSVVFLAAIAYVLVAVLDREQEHAEGHRA